MSVHYFTTPKGEEMAVLPRAELEALNDRALRARDENIFLDAAARTA